MKQSISPLLLVLLLCIVLPSAVCTGSKSSDFGFDYNNGFDSTGSGGDIIPIVIVVIPSDDERSIELCTFAEQNGIKETLKKYSEYDGNYVSLIEEIYQLLKKGSSIKEIVSYIDGLSGKEIKV